MNDCPPTAFCPDHPVDPGLLVLIAVALIAIALFATAAVLLVVTLDTAARYIRRRIIRARHATTAAADTAAAEESDPAPPAHLAVIAAALDEWWLITDPHAEFNGADIAPFVDLHLDHAGYHVTPNP